MNVHYEVRGEHGPAAHCLHPKFKILTKDKNRVTCKRCLKQIAWGERTFALLAKAGHRINERGMGRAVASDVDWFGGE